ncbi:MAG: hypothetical protein Q8P67_13385, partial [archaeon]|nr:hypothetical protein [archaeon]
MTGPSSLLAPGCSSARLLSSTTPSGHLDGTSAVYLEQMHEAWKKDPSSVHVSWASYFKNLQAGVAQPLVAPPNLFKTSPVVEPAVSSSPAGGASAAGIQDQLNLWSLIRAYRVRGHHAANLDPLGRERLFKRPEELSIEAHGFTQSDLDRVIPLNGNKLTLQELVADLKNTYCGTIGLEFMQVANADQVKWLQTKLEEYNK